MKQRIVLFLILFLLTTNNSYARSMGDFWDSLEGMSNVTNPKFIKGQKVGHLSLGSLQMRSKVTNGQLTALRMPAMNAGCGGIDFYAGGFSFISSDQLVALMKSIASNAQGALVQLAIDNLSPKIGSIIKYFQNVSRNINSLNINSCETARNLSGAAFGDFEGIKNQGCKIAGNVGNLFTDSASGFEACSSGGQATETLKNAPKEVKDQYPANDINIAWKSLKDSGLLSFDSDKDVQLAELLMSLSGTIIVKAGNSDDDKPEFISKFPKIEDDSTVKAFLEGGKFTGLKCEDADNCLDVTDQEYNIEAKDSYLGKVSAALDDIAAAISADDETSLKDGTYKLLSFSSLPVYNILRINESYFKGSNTETGSLSEFIALDILYGYLQEINGLMRKAAAKYDNESYRKIFETFFENQKEIKKSLNAKRSQLSEKYADQLRIIERAMKVEQMLKHRSQGNIKFGQY